MVHINLNCKSWYIRATASPGTAPEGANSIERDSTNYAPLSVYSTISNVLQIGVLQLKFLVKFITNMDGIKYSIYTANCVATAYIELNSDRMLYSRL